MAILGMGVDCVEVSRIQKIQQKFSSQLAQRLLTPQEREALPKLEAQRARFIAKRFAAKEAVLKALGIGLWEGLSWQQIRIAHDSYGKPSIVLTDAALSLAKRQGVQNFHVSISDEKTIVVACVIAED